MRMGGAEIAVLLGEEGGEKLLQTRGRAGAGQPRVFALARPGRVPGGSEERVEPNSQMEERFLSLWLTIKRTRPLSIRKLVK